MRAFSGGEQGQAKEKWQNAAFIRQTPEQATCRKLSEEYKEALKKGETRKRETGLKDYLQGRQANGIIFTTILGADQTITALCEDIIRHYEDRQYELTGKAMIVAYSRPIAMSIHKSVRNVGG